MRRWTELWSLAAIGLSWLVSFATSYWFFTRHLNANAYLNEFWAGQMLPAPLTLTAAFKWVGRSGMDLAGTALGTDSYPSSLGLVAALLAALLAFVGWWHLWRTERWTSVLWILPGALTAVAAALRLYPFGGRLILFLVPTFLSLVGHGFVIVLERYVGPRSTVFMGVTIALLTVTARLPVPGATDHLQQLGNACRHVATHLSQGDGIYLFYPNKYACLYSMRQAGVDEARIVIGAGDAPGPFGAINHLEAQLQTLPLPSWGGLWAVVSHSRIKNGNDEAEIVLSHFRAVCAPLHEALFGEVRVAKFICGRD